MNCYFPEKERTSVLTQFKFAQNMKICCKCINPILRFCYYFIYACYNYSSMSWNLFLFIYMYQFFFCLFFFFYCPFQEKLSISRNSSQYFRKLPKKENFRETAPREVRNISNKRSSAQGNCKCDVPGMFAPNLPQQGGGDKTGQVGYHVPYMYTNRSNCPRPAPIAHTGWGHGDRTGQVGRDILQEMAFGRTPLSALP